MHQKVIKETKEQFIVFVTLWSVSFQQSVETFEELLETSCQTHDQHSLVNALDRDRI